MCVFFVDLGGCPLEDAQQGQSRQCPQRQHGGDVGGCKILRSSTSRLASSLTAKRMHATGDILWALTATRAAPSYLPKINVV